MGKHVKHKTKNIEWKMENCMHQRMLPDNSRTLLPLSQGSVGKWWFHVFGVWEVPGAAGGVEGGPSRTAETTEATGGALRERHWVGEAIGGAANIPTCNEQPKT